MDTYCKACNHNRAKHFKNIDGDIACCGEYGRECYCLNLSMEEFEKKQENFRREQKKAKKIRNSRHTNNRENCIYNIQSEDDHNAFYCECGSWLLDPGFNWLQP